MASRLNFSINITGIEDSTLVVVDYHGQESLSDSVFSPSNTPFETAQMCYGFRYHINLASRLDDLAALDIVDKMAELTVIQDGLVTQRVNGIVRDFTKSTTGHHHTYYSLTLYP